MKAIQQIMDNLSEKEKYLMGLIDQLYLKPREGVPDQHFLHVRGVLCDIIECDLTDKYIYYLENRKFIDLDDLLNFFYAGWEVEIVDDDDCSFCDDEEEND